MITETDRNLTYQKKSYFQKQKEKTMKDKSCVKQKEIW